MIFNHLIIMSNSTFLISFAPAESHFVGIIKKLLIRSNDTATVTSIVSSDEGQDSSNKDTSLVMKTNC